MEQLKLDAEYTFTTLIEPEDSLRLDLMNHANGIESPYIDEDLLQSRLNCFQIPQNDENEMSPEKGPSDNESFNFNLNLNGSGGKVSLSHCYTNDFELNLDNKKKLSSQIAKDIEKRLKRKTGGVVYGRIRKTWERAPNNNNANAKSGTVFRDITTSGVKRAKNIAN